MVERKLTALPITGMREEGRRGRAGPLNRKGLPFSSPQPVKFVRHENRASGNYYSAIHRAYGFRRSTVSQLGARVLFGALMRTQGSSI